MRRHSLSTRLLFSTSLVMVVFFALMAMGLSRSFLESAEQALKETLQIRVHSLLSAAELTRSGALKMPDNLQEPRFADPGSGLYAFINNGKNIIWRSPSAIGLDIEVPPKLLVGKAVFEKDTQHNQYHLHHKISWETNRKSPHEYIFSVSEDAVIVVHQANRFKKTLILWLGVIGILLTLIQVILLRWGLKPLRTIVSDLEKIEAGEKQQLDGTYPSELRGLAGNLNTLINSERAHNERYRNTLADLAHSLKTPLAILRGGVKDSGANSSGVMDEQITRMNEIVEYQLQRAALKGDKKIIGKVDLVEITYKIITSLDKVYADKNIQFNLDLPERCWVYCQEGDVYEIVGNLLDNACKWCNQQIIITVNNANRGVGSSLILHIEDDGPGIPADKLKAILQRGVRADENIHGHGIGMAVVNEMIQLHGGQLQGLKSPSLGGMYWRVHLP